MAVLVVALVFGVAVWLVLAFATASVARSKGRKYGTWWVVGALLGLIGLIWAAALPTIPAASSSRSLAWRPTHQVPPGGMAILVKPHPGAEQRGRLGEGVGVLLSETKGTWARVTRSNGQANWVDARLLVPLSASPPRVRCPFCNQLIQPQATVCRWCGRDLPGQGSAEPPPPPA